MEPRKGATEQDLLHEIFPPGTQKVHGAVMLFVVKEFVIEAPSERRKRRRQKRFLGRFPRGVPSFVEEDSDKNWELKGYADNAETGEPGGWMLEDGPSCPTHKGTPASATDIKNLVVLKLTDYGTMEVSPIDEAFNFRPTVRHKVYSLEEAELLMSAKRKPKLTPSLKAQLETADRDNAKVEIEEPGEKTATSHKSQSDSEASETELVQKKREKKKAKTMPAEREIRAARAPRPVEATDALIEQIKPEDVEDWEYSEEEPDDDVNMGGDFEEHEKDEIEAEYKKYHESDTSEDEEYEKLDEKGKELKKLIKNGAPEFVPSPSSPETKGKKKNAPATTDPPLPEEKSNNPPATKKPPSTSVPKAKAKKETVQVQPASVGSPRPRSPPNGLSVEAVRSFLESSGAMALKPLIEHFRPVIHAKAENRQFVAIVKQLTRWEERDGEKVVTLRPEYRAV